jgi:DNA-binding MarR family transcriptional regulator
MVPHEIPPTFRLADGLRDFYDRTRRLMDRGLKQHGVSYARTKVLLFLSNRVDARSADVAAAFGFAPRTVTEALDGMEREGLIMREPDPRDRRVKRVVVTPLGKAAVRELEPVQEALIARLFGCLEPEEQVMMADLVERLNQRLVELEQ